MQLELGDPRKGDSCYRLRPVSWPWSRSAPSMEGFILSNVSSYGSLGEEKSSFLPSCSVYPYLRGRLRAGCSSIARPGGMGSPAEHLHLAAEPIAFKMEASQNIVLVRPLILELRLPLFKSVFNSCSHNLLSSPPRACLPMFFNASCPHGLPINIVLIALVSTCTAFSFPLPPTNPQAVLSNMQNKRKDSNSQTRIEHDG